MAQNRSIFYIFLAKNCPIFYIFWPKLPNFLHFLGQNYPFFNIFFGPKLPNFLHFLAKITQFFTFFDTKLPNFLHFLAKITQFFIFFGQNCPIFYIFWPQNFFGSKLDIFARKKKYDADTKSLIFQGYVVTRCPILGYDVLQQTILIITYWWHHFLSNGGNLFILLCMWPFLQKSKYLMRKTTWNLRTNRSTITGTHVVLPLTNWPSTDLVSSQKLSRGGVKVHFVKTTMRSLIFSDTALTYVKFPWERIRIDPKKCKSVTFLYNHRTWPGSPINS